MPSWADGLPAGEREALLARGLGASLTPGLRPALVVVDVVHVFLGSEPDGAATEALPLACGPEGWRRLPTVIRLLEHCRSAGIPRVLTKGSWTDARAVGGAIKLTQDRGVAERVHNSPFPAALTPAEDEYVVEKAKPSAFFGTHLLTFLTRHSVDSLIVCGTTTSGCVRATVVDAHSYGYRVTVVEDACFDRSSFAHAANLFDMQMKYAEVTDCDGAMSRVGPA